MMVFLDVEASGFHGFPIEVAWCSADLTAGRSWLIHPTDWPSHLEWDDAAERIHGLSFERLEAEGLPPEQVAEELADDLMAASAVLSDNVPMDHGWLVELYCWAGKTRPVPFHLEEADVVAVAARGHLAAAGLEPVARGLAAEAGLVPHRALDDCIRQAITLCVARGDEPDAIVWRARRLLAEHGRDE